MSSIFESPELAPEEVAARLLVTPSALADLTLGDALKVVGYMRPKLIKAGTVIIQEGEVRQTDYMLLVLEGDIAVENELPGLHESMVVNIMGPGHLIGEMGVLDGAPRSATCTANTNIAAAHAWARACCSRSPNAWPTACVRPRANSRPLPR